MSGERPMRRGSKDARGKSAEAAFRGLEGGTGDPKKLSYVLACMALQPKHAWKQSALTQRP